MFHLEYLNLILNLPADCTKRNIVFMFTPNFAQYPAKTTDCLTFFVFYPYC